jgi:hypothetical protein
MAGATQETSAHVFTKKLGWFSFGNTTAAASEVEDGQRSTSEQLRWRARGVYTTVAAGQGPSIIIAA